MNPLFQTVSGLRPHKSRFDGGHDLIFTTRFGKLTPCFCEPVIPGDIFDERAEVFSRMLPLLAPLMHRNNIFIHYFFVPNRLIWDDWEDFITGGEDGTLNPVWPRMVIESHADYTDWRSLMVYYSMFHTSSLADYLGFPVIKKSICNYIRKEFEEGRDSDYIANAIFASIRDKQKITINNAYAISYTEFLDDPYFLTTFFSFGHSSSAYAYGGDNNVSSFYNEFLNKYNIEPASCNIVVDLMPFRAHLKIYNDYYRDQNLEEEIEFSTLSGIDYIDYSEDISFDYQLFETRLRAWEKDYFTSALPFAQRGPEVKIPLGGDEEVYATLTGLLTSDNDYNRLGVVMVDRNGEAFVVQRTNTNGQFTDGDGNLIPYNSDGSQTINVLDVNEGSDYANFVHSGRLKLDLSGVTSATINDLRKAFQVQKWEERNARGGGRYPEQILSHFGVVCPDFRLQRPEYLGGGMTPISVNMVTQTSEDNTTPLGTMAGQGLAVGRTNKFRKFFVEHGYVIGLLSVMPRSNYHTGLPAKFNRFDRFEHYFPEFAHIGEQPIRNSEIFYSGTKRDDDEFGYQGVYMSYKWFQSRIAGDMKDTLKYWNMSRSFDLENLPVLNNDFIKVNPDILSDIFAIDLSDRVFVDYTLPWFQRQVPEDEIIIQMYHNLKAYRPMPFNSEPGWIDHF